MINRDDFNQHMQQYAWCLTCDSQRITQGWTSGNGKIDKYIKEFQLKTTKYENSHKPSYGVDLEILPSSQNLLDFLKVKDHIQLENKEYDRYGITQNATTNEYMVNGQVEIKRLMKEIQFKATEFGVVVEWTPFSRLDNIQKISESESGWTSGNKQIDEFIKEFQLKATEYDNVIEWIPFNRFESIQIINKYEFGSIFFAKWLDGIRIISDDTQSRYAQLTDKEYKVFGMTQNMATNEYILLKATKYEDVIEWIPFNKLDKVKMISKDGLNSESSAIWLENIKIVTDILGEYKYKVRKCRNFDRYNTSLDFCQTYGPWTSGNMNIDECIKEYEGIIEWIPFHGLDNIKIIGKGDLAQYFQQHG
ncbi:hypothetical protein C2G38_2242297 [Gigaspora rosea]|uniref:Uncharacterized protein n=1 Tax=Gigaspora rosea TaxID=44941 RepID=A0A397VPX1_9GLOM|nr:hypothetical protein C2G38_2242297 [Gigaspora rosea]